MSGFAATLSAIVVTTSSGATLWSVKARLPRRLRLVAKAPAFVKSVEARSSTALRSSVTARSSVEPSVPRSEVGFTVRLRAIGVSPGASLAAGASEFSLAAALVAVGFAVAAAVVEAGLELDSCFFSTGLLVSDDAVVFEASSVFLVSAGATLFSVAAGVTAASVFSVAEAGVSEVAVAVPERSIFGTDAPSPYALEAAGASA